MQDLHDGGGAHGARRETRCRRRRVDARTAGQLQYHGRGSNWTPSPLGRIQWSDLGHDIECRNQLEMGKGEDGQDGNLNRITWAFVWSSTPIFRETLPPRTAPSPHSARGTLFPATWGPTGRQWTGRDGWSRHGCYTVLPCFSTLHRWRAGAGRE